MQVSITHTRKKIYKQKKYGRKLTHLIKRIDWI